MVLMVFCVEAFWTDGWCITSEADSSGHLLILVCFFSLHIHPWSSSHYTAIVSLFNAILLNNIKSFLKKKSLQCVFLLCRMCRNSDTHTEQKLRTSYNMFGTADLLRIL